MPTFEGQLSACAGRFAIVAARFNVEVVAKLVAGAKEGLTKHGVAEDHTDLVWVPGSFEIPLVAQRLAASKKYAAVICLGAVIRGDTDHYDYVCQAAATGIAQVSLDTGVPVIFGVLTCASEQQALDRAGGNEGNKGYAAAVTGITMANLLKQLP